MSTADLNRVQDELNHVKEAIGFEFPYDRRHVWLCLLTAGAGILMALTAVPHWREAMRYVLVAYFVGIIAIWFWLNRRISAERTLRPRVWRWNRRETVASLVGIGLLVPYVVMIRLLGEQRGAWGFEGWRDQVAGPLLFVVGVAVTSLAAASREFRSGLGWGVAAIVGSLIIPWCDTVGPTRLAAGAALFVGGVASAAILLWQIRDAEQSDVAH